jgi:putative ABC transport system ATP-binding protein
VQTIDPILTVHQLGRQLGQQWLWRKLSFELKLGETLGIVGPSGIGKSLLMRSLVYLDSFEEGQVRFQGQAIHHWDKTALRRKMLYFAQSPGILEGTVEENLKAVWMLKRQREEGDRTYSREAVLTLFKALGRGDAFLSLTGDRLSGGERQLLGLVRGLQLNPQVLLLDEPTAALDLETAEQVEDLLQTWVKDADHRAYLWISHDPAQITRMTQSQLDLSRFVP